MDVKKRINARKIVLSLFYQHCFFSLLSKKGIAGDVVKPFDEIQLSDSDKKSKFFDDEFLKLVEEKKQNIVHLDQMVQDKIKDYANRSDIDEEFSYMLKFFFDQWSNEDIDIEYILHVGNALPLYEKELQGKVDRYTKSFGYEKMDPIDQALLLMGYIEYKTIQTPKEVIINEMIELAKRYGDEGSPKLINGILHELFLAET